MMTSVPPPAYALPRLDELVGPWSIPSWLSSQYEELGRSDKLYRRFAAMGLVANRFIPDSSRELTVYVDDNHADELERRAMTWLMTQLPEDLKQVSHEAELEALSLVSEFDALEARDWPINDLLLLALAREILESVTVLLRRRGYASRIMPTLTVLDEAACERIPFNRLPPPPFRPQSLLAVRGLAPKSGGAESSAPCP